MRILGLLIVMFHCAFASAEFELKAHYGALTAKADSFNKDMETNAAGFPDVGGVKLMGADAVYSLPVVSFAFGLRYEMFDFKEDGFSGALETKITGSRVSLLGGYRLLETPVGYLGLLAHYAVSQELNYNLKVVGTSDTKYKGSMDSSYGAGVDAAIKLSHFLVGAEVGYTMLKAKDLKDSSTGNYLGVGSKKSSLDLSGPYYKVMIGISI